MKQIITVAAYLAAGAAFASATELSDANATITTPSNGYTTDDGTFSVVLSFDVDTLHSNLMSGDGSHLVSYSASDGRTRSVYAVYRTTYSSSGQSSSSDLYYYKEVRIGAPEFTEITSSSNTLVGSTDNLVNLSWDSITGAGLVYTHSASGGSTVSFSLVGSDGTEIYSAYSTASGFNSGTSDAVALSFGSAVTTAWCFNDVLSSDDAKSLSYAAATPEPSAFGLLAGLGALALVASRRKRK